MLCNNKFKHASVRRSVLPVSPNSWKRARSPRKMPAVTGPEWSPNRIVNSPVSGPEIEIRRENPETGIYIAWAWWAFVEVLVIQRWSLISTYQGWLPIATLDPSFSSCLQEQIVTWPPHGQPLARAVLVLKIRDTESTVSIQECTIWTHGNVEEDDEMMLTYHKRRHLRARGRMHKSRKFG